MSSGSGSGQAVIRAPPTSSQPRLPSTVHGPAAQMRRRRTRSTEELAGAGAAEPSEEASCCNTDDLTRTRLARDWQSSPWLDSDTSESLASESSLELDGSRGLEGGGLRRVAGQRRGAWMTACGQSRKPTTFGGRPRPSWATAAAAQSLEPACG